MTRLFTLAWLWFCVPLAASAGTVTVAVAANFLPTLQTMAPVFAAETGHRLRFVHGSSGRLYAQILARAPFDMFLSADTARADALLAAGIGRDRRSYAIGRLVLVGPAPAIEGTLPDILSRHRIAVADPAVAPYGRAAFELLAALGLDAGQLRLVRGETIAQAALFVATGNAELGLLARSLAPAVLDGRDLAQRAIPSALHAPIRQDAILLSDTPAAQSFWRWLDSPAADTILVAAGYEVPD